MRTLRLAPFALLGALALGGSMALTSTPAQDAQAQWKAKTKLELANFKAQLKTILATFNAAVAQYKDDKLRYT